MSTDLDGATHGLGAFRECPHGRGIAYLAVMETVGPRAVDTMLTAARRVGTVHDAGLDCRGHVGMLDGYDAEGIDLAGEWCIPTEEAWQWWRRAIELRASSSDCPRCEPAAWTAIHGDQ